MELMRQLHQHGNYLEFLDIEGGADDHAVCGPLLALVAHQPVGQPLDDAVVPAPLEVPKLVAHNLPRQFRVVHDHPRRRAEPSHRNFPCNSIAVLGSLL
jgi:hypothetical protein